MDFSTLSFIGALALHQNRRDTALGLTHVTTRQRGLIWYYNVRQGELIIEAHKKSFVHGAMQQIDQQMAQIMTEVETATIDRKRELLKEAVELKKRAQRIRKIG